MNGGIDRIIMVQCNELTNSGRKKKMENDFMLNEDKIKLMTGIALFEKREGKHIFPANRYFRSDYISGLHRVLSLPIPYASFYVRSCGCFTAWSVF